MTPMLRRRETMIALRARHQALDVTRDIAYPPLDVPPPPVPVIPPNACEDDRPGRPCVRLHPLCYQIILDRDLERADDRPPSKLVSALMSDLVLSILGILIGLGTILLCKYG